MTITRRSALTLASAGAASLVLPHAQAAVDDVPVSDVRPPQY
jgi:hypothetical protein